MRGGKILLMAAISELNRFDNRMIKRGQEIIDGSQIRFRSVKKHQEKEGARENTWQPLQVLVGLHISRKERGKEIIDGSHIRFQ
jgi:hypothetical protein